MSLQNTHNAMASGIGTMYQFLFFARRSLSLHSGENIGFERFDENVGLNVKEYFTYVFSRLIEGEKDYEKLLPSTVAR